MKAGVYGPDGPYYYRYFKDGRILLSHSGGMWRSVAKGTTAYFAILAKIPVLPRLSSKEVKALERGMTGGASASADTGVQVASSAPVQRSGPSISSKWGMIALAVALVGVAGWLAFGPVRGET